MLTAKQRQCYDFLKGYTEAHGGVSPSYIEIAKAIGITSKGGVHRFLVALEERGRIRRMPNRTRAIEVIPESSTASPRAIPTVSYPDAKFFVWSDEAKALVPMEVRK